MKAFGSGLAIGALTCFVVIRTTDQDPTPSVNRVTTSAVSKEATPTVNPSCAAGVDKDSAALSNNPARATERPASNATIASAPVPALPNASHEVRPDWIERLSEREADEVCTRAHQLRRAREQAAKDAEPKDVGWAYSMEQLIRQHTEMHLPADKYTKLQVECRTTFCEMRLEGPNLDDQTVAAEVLHQIPQQVWSDVVQKGYGSGSDGRAWYIEYEWFRPRTEAERRLHFGDRQR